MMGNLVFVGAEACGYCSGACAREGVFVSSQIYEKFESELIETFSNKYFHELDGKHSEVQGDLVIKSFSDEVELVAYVGEVDDYSEYLFSEYAEDLEEEDINAVSKDILDNIEKIQSLSKKYATYQFTLSSAEYEHLNELLESIRESKKICDDSSRLEAE